ncbi:hypothetical protein DBV15_10774, partial [Temnothorax longispinosus]
MTRRHSIPDRLVQVFSTRSNHAHCKAFCIKDFPSCQIRSSISTKIQGDLTEARKKFYFACSKRSENRARITSELQSFGAAGTQLRPVPYSHGELGRSITEISRRDV